MEFAILDWLRQHHPAWRLLSSPHAALIASFLHRVFVAPNERVIAQADLAEALEDELFVLRESRGAEAFPKSALEYLNDGSRHPAGVRGALERCGQAVLRDLRRLNAEERALTELEFGRGPGDMH